MAFNKGNEDQKSEIGWLGIGAYKGIYY